MTIKKKLGAGVMSAALGISLIGGGTWAAFNDIETVSNTFAAGTLNLAVNPKHVFNIDKLAPGDWKTEEFTLENKGSIEIKEVFMATNYVVKDKNGVEITDEALREEFANQFTVQFLDNEGDPVRYGQGGTYFGIPFLGDLEGYTIHQLSQHKPDITTAFHGLWGVIDSTDRKLAVGDTDTMEMRIKFENILDDANEDGLYDQNKFQGWTIKPTFTLEATQRDGMSRD
ncbi:TasA family protein [Bacillus sp. m3-13]|uniref:TasA family protein n=1 Tax=Bacillus sp. m3-13 TaxID=406124 RepID=UPI0001E89CD2|nr:TasA family protein [Bacillus sp. m3-13]